MVSKSVKSYFDTLNVTNNNTMYEEKESLSRIPRQDSLVKMLRNNSISISSIQDLGSKKMKIITNNRDSNKINFEQKHLKRKIGKIIDPKKQEVFFFFNYFFIIYI